MSGTEDAGESDQEVPVVFAGPSSEAQPSKRPRTSSLELLVESKPDSEDLQETQPIQPGAQTARRRCGNTF